jgi:hypothetical protein
MDYQRMTDLKKRKLLVQLSKAEQQLAAIDVLYDASTAYFNWLKVFN